MSALHCLALLCAVAAGVQAAGTSSTTQASQLLHQLESELTQLKGSLIHTL